MNTALKDTNANTVVKKLVLSCDLGGSQVKAIAQIYPDGIPCVLAMGPEIADVSSVSIERLTAQQLKHSTSTWLGIGDEYYVLGPLAKTLFAGTAALRDLKYHYAVPKIAGLVWLASQRFKLKEPFEILIQILLPPGEVNDGKNLAPQMAKALKRGIITPNGKLKAKVLNFYVCAEGTGIVTYRSNALGKMYNQKNLGILMLGYRNASFTLSEKGNPARAESTDLGMSWLINSFVETTAVGLSKDDSRLITAILAAGEGKFDAFRPLSRKANDIGVKSDLELFQKVLPSVRDQYCRALVRWIRNIASLDEVLICGGTAEFVKKELTEHFQREGTPIVWNGNVHIPAPLDTLGLGQRVADVWIAHITYAMMLDKNFGYDRKQDFVPDPNKPQPEARRLPSIQEYIKNKSSS